jgi:hypothetical protein
MLELGTSSKPAAESRALVDCTLADFRSNASNRTSSPSTQQSEVSSFQSSLTREFESLSEKREMFDDRRFDPPKKPPANRPGPLLLRGRMRRGTSRERRAGVSHEAISIEIWRVMRTFVEFEIRSRGEEKEVVAWTDESQIDSAVRVLVPSFDQRKYNLVSFEKA